uniref:Rhodanese domain-containing protein n=1 Tax=Rhabditophanes sp. KR3021 TaxID=114890 RepID=A0AC35TS24_9BILA
MKTYFIPIFLVSYYITLTNAKSTKSILKTEDLARRLLIPFYRGSKLITISDLSNKKVPLLDYKFTPNYIQLKYDHFLLNPGETLNLIKSDLNHIGTKTVSFNKTEFITKCKLLPIYVLFDKQTNRQILSTTKPTTNKQIIGYCASKSGSCGASIALHKIDVFGNGKQFRQPNFGSILIKSYHYHSFKKVVQGNWREAVVKTQLNYCYGWGGLSEVAK